MCTTQPIHQFTIQPIHYSTNQPMHFSLVTKCLLPFCLSGLLLWSCTSSNSQRVKAAKVSQEAGVFGGLENNLPVIDLSGPPAKSQQITNYLDFYGLNFDQATHHFGQVNAKGFKIAVHMYRPVNPAGSAIIVHGYNDHSGLQTRLIATMLNLNLSVLTFDLPGHGLSSGERSTIDDFQQYLDVFADVKQRFESFLPQPHYLMGHSTGGAIAFDYLLNNSDHRFEKLILLAPLVRSARWRLSKTGHFMLKPFKKTIGRRFHPESSDSAYVEFWLNDPLQHPDISLKWIQAMFNWEENLNTELLDSIPTLIIQGKQDGVVEWKHNVPFLESKFPNHQTLMLETARHQLVNEGGALRDSIYQTIRSFLTTDLP